MRRSGGTVGRHREGGAQRVQKKAARPGQKLISITFICPTLLTSAMLSSRLLSGILPFILLLTSSVSGLALPESHNESLEKRCTTHTGLVGIRLKGSYNVIFADTAPGTTVANSDGTFSHVDVGIFGTTYWQGRAGVFTANDCGDGAPVELSCQVSTRLCSVRLYLSHSPGALATVELHVQYQQGLSRLGLSHRRQCHV